MVKYWDCGEVPSITNLVTDFVDSQVGEALKSYMDDLTIFIRQEDGEILLEAFIISYDENNKPIKKEFALSDLIRANCIYTDNDGTMHPLDLEGQVIEVSAALKKLARELDEAAEEIQEANKKSGREWVYMPR
jgi:hypothetical protein